MEPDCDLTPHRDEERSFRSVFSSALLGRGCHVEWLDDRCAPLPVGHWSDVADAADRAVLEHCVGPTLDLGCGPGRMAEHLASRGQRVLAVDVVPEAAALAALRGLSTWVGDVFEPLPEEGTWGTALLADGNIGIGGDPARLLRRVRDLVAPGGRVVVDLAAPGSGIRHRWARIRTVHHTSRPFRWAEVAADAVEPLARAAGLARIERHDHRGRWFAVLEASR